MFRGSAVRILMNDFLFSALFPCFICFLYFIPSAHLSLSPFFNECISSVCALFFLVLRLFLSQVGGCGVGVRGESADGGEKRPVLLQASTPLPAASQQDQVHEVSAEGSGSADAPVENDLKLIFVSRIGLIANRAFKHIFIF